MEVTAQSCTVHRCMHSRLRAVGPPHSPHLPSFTAGTEWAKQLRARQDGCAALLMPPGTLTCSRGAGDSVERAIRPGPQPSSASAPAASLAVLRPSAHQAGVEDKVHTETRSAAKAGSVQVSDGLGSESAVKAAPFQLGCLALPPRSMWASSQCTDQTLAACSHIQDCIYSSFSHDTYMC